MWLLIVISLYFSVHVFSADVPEVKIELKLNEKGVLYCSDVTVQKLMLNRAFLVTVHSDVRMNDGRCYNNADGQTRIYIDSFQNKTDYIISSQVLADMNMDKKFICNITVDRSNISPVQCYLTLDIRNTKLGELLVNGHPQEMQAASKQDTYDSVGHYKYFEGEEAHIMCKSQNYKQARSSRIIYNTNTKVYGEISTIEATNFVEMYMKLTKSHVGFIDCQIREKWGHGHSHVIRLLLDKNTAPRTAHLAFQVNGLTLNNIAQDKKELIYEYKYYDGEELTIQSDKDDNRYGITDCLGTNFPNDTRIPSSWQNEQSIIINSTLLEERSKNTSMSCFVRENNYGKADDRELTVSLNLRPNDFNYTLYIKGLSLANVLLKYKSSVNTTMIYYGYYNKNEPLRLRCYSHSEKPIWNSFGTNIKEQELENSSGMDENVFEIAATFWLLDNQDSANINCTSSTENVIMILKKIEVPPTIIPSPPVTKKNNTDDQIPMMYILIAVGILTLLLIFIVILVIFRLTNRKSQKQNPNPTDINYQNLPEHHERSMPTPTQWNEATYSRTVDCLEEDNYAVPATHRTVEDMYSKPLPKNQRGFTRPTYEDPAYAAVGASEPTYAQPLPKNKRFAGNVRVLPKDANEILYAEVGLKPGKPLKPRQESLYSEVAYKNKTYEEAGYSESPYAEVSSNESPYAEVNPTQQNKYVNVLNNTRSYVNVNSTDDYAEPAYCEVNINK